MAGSNPTAPYWERPCAAPGLLSYRYANGPFGYVMIGAKDDIDALHEAGRSVSADIYPSKLERWNGTAYEKVWPPC